MPLLLRPPSPPTIPFIVGAPTFSSQRIPVVLGTVSIPVQMDAEAALEALDYFHAAGFNEVDTAILYEGGKTEVTLGKANAALKPTNKHSWSVQRTACG